MSKRKPDLGSRYSAKSGKTQYSKNGIKTILPKIRTVKTTMPNQAKGLKQMEIKLLTKITLPNQAKHNVT